MFKNTESLGGAEVEILIMRKLSTSWIYVSFKGRERNTRTNEGRPVNHHIINDDGVAFSS